MSQLSLLGAGLSGAGSPAFSPLDLNPVVWLESDAGLYQERSSPSTPASALNDPVGTWQDQSGNGNHCVAPTDGQRPAFISSTSGMLFASTDYLSAPDTPVLDTLGDITLVMVLKPTDRGNYYFLLTKTDAMVGHHTYEWRLEPTTGYPNYISDTGAPVTATAAPSLAAPSLIAVKRTGGTVTHYLNGATNGSGTDTLTPHVSNNALFLATRSDNYSYYQGSIIAVLIYNQALGGDDLTNVFNYLNEKYNIY